jgi:hypothetical protein
MIQEVKLTHRTAGGTLVRSAATLEYKEGRIWFLKSPFALKDEIKAMSGSKWHGYEPELDKRRNIWSVKDCQRNRFQLSFLMDEDVYAWFDREVVKHEYQRPLMSHQKDLADHFLTYHYGIMAAEMRTGKTLAAQEIIERSGIKTPIWWVGPKTSLPNIRREFRIWNLDPSVTVELMTYEGLKRIMEEWEQNTPVPQMLIGDEISRCKGATSQRTTAMQELADKIRATYGYEGYVIEMSGTPAPKSPVDWWAPCEIAWPGFLKEGSPKALEARLAFMVDKQFDAGIFKARVGWRDDERKCNVCGQMEHDTTDHAYTPSVNEVSYLNERLKGLVIVKHLKDCVELPSKTYRTVTCPPNASTVRVAQALSKSAPNAMTAMTWLRELSDGFLYRDIVDGTVPCTHCHGAKEVEEWQGADGRLYEAVDMFSPELIATLTKIKVKCPKCEGTGEMPKIVRLTKEVPCPKDQVVRDLLGECEETGRIVIFAGFTGSVDRVTNLCRKEKWDVVRCDGRGWCVTHDNNIVLNEEPLDYWANLEAHPRVAFVAHPESGGMSFTLRESRMVVFYSNTFKPEYRGQAAARIQSIGKDNPGLLVVDIFHLPSDRRVRDIIHENRKLELMSMGEALGDIAWEASTGEPIIEEVRA